MKQGEGMGAAGAAHQWGLGDPVGQGQQCGFCPRCCGSHWSVQQGTDRLWGGFTNISPAAGWGLAGGSEASGEGSLPGSEDTEGTLGRQGCCGLWAGSSNRQRCCARAKGRQPSIDADSAAGLSSWPGDQAPPLQAGAGPGAHGTGAGDEVRTGRSPDLVLLVRGPDALPGLWCRPSPGAPCKMPATTAAFKAHTFPGSGYYQPHFSLRKWKIRDINGLAHGHDPMKIQLGLRCISGRRRPAASRGWGRPAVQDAACLPAGQ